MDKRSKESLICMNDFCGAWRIAAQCHVGQIDKGGMDYIFHPLFVCKSQKTMASQIVAILHDVVEDTDMTIDVLLRFGFSADVVSAVDAITKKKAESYEDYIIRVSKNDIAKHVKISDLRHNCELKRIQFPTERDLVRVRRYQKAISVLERG